MTDKERRFQAVNEVIINELSPDRPGHSQFALDYNFAQHLKDDADFFMREHIKLCPPSINFQLSYFPDENLR